MKIAVVGAGALGSVLAALLHEAGLDVVLVERDPDKVRHVARNGLRLEGVSGDRLVRPRIVSVPSEAGKVDLAIVAVKSYDTAAAIPTLEEILSPGGVALTLQNGIGNYEVLNDALPGRVLLGTTIMGAMTLGLGNIRHTGFGDTHLGEADGPILERTRVLAAVLEKMKSGPVHVVDNAIGCVWSKLIVNAAVNAPASLLRVRNGDLPSTGEGRALIGAVVRECSGVTEAKGVRLIFDDPEDRVLAVCQGTANNVNSMLQDILAGRRTEIDFINGSIAREAEQLGLSAPVNRTLTQLIKALEATTERRVPDASH